MAVTETPLTSAVSGVDATSYATASINPTDGVLVVGWFGTRCDVGVPNVPTASGASQAWSTPAASETVTSSFGGGHYRVTLFTCISVAGAGAITFDCGGQTQVDAAWSLFELGTTNTGAAIRQTVTATGTSTTPAVTLAAFGNVNNATIAGMYTRGTATTSGITAGTGFTEIHDVADSNLRLETEWQAGNDTSVNATISASEGWGIIGVEVREVSDVLSFGNNKRLLLGIG